MRTVKLHHHRTEGGAEYLTDMWKRNQDGSTEGVIEGSRFVIRIGEDVRKGAEMSYDDTPERADSRPETDRLVSSDGQLYFRMPQEGDIYQWHDGGKVAVSGVYGSMSRVRDLSYEGPDFNVPTGVLAGIRPSGTLQAKNATTDKGEP